MLRVVRLRVDAVYGDVQVIVAGFAAVYRHDILMLVQIKRCERAAPRLEGLAVRRLLTVSPTQNEVHVRIGGPRFGGNRTEFQSRRVARQNALRLDWILADHHLAPLPSNVRHTA